MPTKEDFGDGRNSLLAGRDRRQFLAATGLASADFLAKTTSVRGTSVLRCGRWKIYGLNLPDPVLRKIYSENARRILPGLEGI